MAALWVMHSLVILMLIWVITWNALDISRIEGILNDRKNKVDGGVDSPGGADRFCGAWVPGVTKATHRAAIEAKGSGNKGEGETR